MLNLFDVQSRELRDGILTSAHFDKGYCGVLNISSFEALKLQSVPKKEKGSRVYFDVRGQEWIGGFENPNYAFKNKQLFNRGSQSTYMGMGFDSLDILLTSDGGRFFSAKESYASNTFTSADYCPDRKLTIVRPSTDLEEFSQDLGTMVELMGVPPVDVNKIRREIFNKLGHDSERISQDYPHIDGGELLESYFESDGKRMPCVTDLIVHLHDKGLSMEEIGERIFGKKED